MKARLYVQRCRDGSGEEQIRLTRLEKRREVTLDMRIVSPDDHDEYIDKCRRLAGENTSVFIEVAILNKEILPLHRTQGQFW